MFDPMREVTKKFPEWLAKNKNQLSAEDYSRYGQQYQYFQRIVAVYETEPDNFPRLMELMQDIQEFGQPPAEIIKQLAPGLEFNEQGMPVMPAMGPQSFPTEGMPGMPMGGGDPFSFWRRNAWARVYYFINLNCRNFVVLKLQFSRTTPIPLHLFFASNLVVQ